MVTRLKQHTLYGVFLGILALGLFGSQATYAQFSSVGNLLGAPSFEGEDWQMLMASPQKDTFFNAPIGWSGGALTRPNDVPWRNVYVNGYPHAGDARVHSGSYSIHISRGGGQWTAWLSQTVNTVPDTPIEAGAWAYILHQRNEGYVRIGIDPSGNKNPFSSTVIWGEPSGIPNYWHKLTLSTQATGTRTTIFLFAYQNSPGEPNSVYWDDAFLNGEGALAQVVAPPTSPTQYLPTVQPKFAVSVYEGASFQSGRMGELSPNLRYTLIERGTFWLKINYMGREGYVFISLVNINDAP